MPRPMLQHRAGRVGQISPLTVDELFESSDGQ
nr:MAG TPA: hypothetical protein [Caudoviricetes sp.]